MSGGRPVASARSAHCEGASYLSTTPLSPVDSYPNAVTVFGLLGAAALAFGLLLLPW